MKGLLEQIEKRKGAKFMSGRMIDYAFYDCVTFCLSVYLELGFISKEYFIKEKYASFSKKAETYEILEREIERTEAFKRVEGEPEIGDLLLFSKGNDGHHAAIWLGDRKVAHCIPSHSGESVAVHSFLPPFSNSHTATYRPHGILTATA